MESLANLTKTLEWNIGLALAVIFLPVLIPSWITLGPQKLLRVSKYVRKFPSSYYGAKAFERGTINGYCATVRYGVDILRHGHPYAKSQKVWVHAAHYLSRLDSWCYYLFLVYVLYRIMGLRYGRFKVQGQPGSQQPEYAQGTILSLIMISVYFYFAGAIANPLDGPRVLEEEARSKFRRQWGTK
ncbi:uncharacterized protein BDZ99DRAFT_519975 [Mytilinidion resinicola]|uniref:Uncharacterized protein n=1 Tax=Mytilinidion resinicola TaxID=574789 RepID=A0A6A6YPT1_9PEZI|nr:uncharacterized protein BDZ99DRAFT_519975 [Mytilinidion resinicola]KAF2809877.1 hypothetical protein BDZ99DRAFT_519975 [Mytilinidion resinicola]